MQGRVGRGVVSSIEYIVLVLLIIGAGPCCWSASGVVLYLSIIRYLDRKVV